MARATVVLLGRVPIERSVIDSLESEFGFAFKEVQSLQGLAELGPEEDVIAVLFNPVSLGVPWDETLSAILRALPAAFPILCHGFADHVDWPQAADAGAFHSLPMPIKPPELRQSLGFVWGARHSSKRDGGKKSGRGGPQGRTLTAPAVA